MKYSIVIPRCGGGAEYEGDPAVGCARADVEILDGRGKNPGEARNEALARAQGEWIVYCDADDRLFPAILPVLDRLIAEHPSADLIRYGSVESGRMLVLPQLWQYAYRRSAFGDLRFPGLCMGEDLLYLEQCLRQAQEIVETHEVGYEHIVHRGSLTHRRPSRTIVLDTLAFTVTYLRRIGDGEPRTSYTRFGLSTRLTEHVADWILQLPRDERADVWRQWFAALRDRSLKLTPWANFGRKVLSFAPSRILAVVLFVLPHKLKLLRSALLFKKPLK